MPGKVLFITAMIGTVGFDGVSRTNFWTKSDLHLTDFFASVFGLGRINGGTAAATIGLVGTVAFAYYAYRLAAYAANRLAHISKSLKVGTTADAFVHSLIPIGAAYAIAHYFSFYLFQGQDVIRYFSDPLGGEHNFLGTNDFAINYSLVSANQIWLTQVGAIVIGHVLGLMLAHDRALQVAWIQAGSSLPVRDARVNGSLYRRRPVVARVGDEFPPSGSVVVALDRVPDTQVMRKIMTVIARPISGSAIPSPTPTTAALAITPRLTIASARA